MKPTLPLPLVLERPRACQRRCDRVKRKARTITQGACGFKFLFRFAIKALYHFSAHLVATSSLSFAAREVDPSIVYVGAHPGQEAGTSTWILEDGEHQNPNRNKVVF
jgi:hypothetical protein